MKRARLVLLSTSLIFMTASAGVRMAGGIQVPVPARTPDSGKPAEEGAVSALVQMGVPLGRDPSGRVRWIDAAGSQLTDEALRQLPSLPLLEWLEIGGGKATAAGLQALKDCAALRRLYIHDIDLAGSTLEWLAPLHLEALSLQRTGISGAALKQLKSADTLTVLNLSENGITDEDLGEVARFANLEVLALQETKVTGAGVARLKNMSRLNVLNLKYCRFVDADLDIFLSMPNLRIVHAAGCNLSDDAVKNLTAKFQMLAIFR